MTVTIRHLVGTRESLDIVIAAHLTANWNSSNISDSLTPTIEALPYIPSYNIEEDYATNPNIIKCSVINRRRTDNDENEPNGDVSHNWQTEIQLDLWAETPQKLQEFEDEVNRILWEIAPNASTRLKKSDGVEATLAVGTEDSEIEFFEKSEVNFEFLGTDDDSAGRVSSTGVLICNWFKIKT